MTAREDSNRKRDRVTREKLTEIKRLFREGMSISEISRSTGFHRHTIRMHLKEKFEDVVADEVRKQVLTEGLQNHFQELSEFARVDLKSQLDASVPEPEKRGVRTQEPIFVGGQLGLPCKGTPQYMTKDWVRMYHPSPKQNHLLKSLRGHTMESTIWIYWDKWRKRVSAYEDSSKAIWEWLEEKTEDEPIEKFHPLDIESFKALVFGNILRVAIGEELLGPEIMMQDTSDEGIILTVKSKNSPLYQYMAGLLGKAGERPEWSALELATKELMNSESQRELRRIVKEIDDALVSIELMHAFPGHCELCPV